MESMRRLAVQVAYNVVMMSTVHNSSEGDFERPVL